MGQVNPHGNDRPGNISLFSFSIELSPSVREDTSEWRLFILLKCSRKSNLKFSVASDQLICTQSEQSLIYCTVYSDMSCLDESLGIGFSTVCRIQYPATWRSKLYADEHGESRHAKALRVTRQLLKRHAWVREPAEVDVFTSAWQIKASLRSKFLPPWFQQEDERLWN